MGEGSVLTFITFRLLRELRQVDVVLDRHFEQCSIQ